MGRVPCWDQSRSGYAMRGGRPSPRRKARSKKRLITHQGFWIFRPSLRLALPTASLMCFSRSKHLASILGRCYFTISMRNDYRPWSVGGVVEERHFEARHFGGERGVVVSKH